MSLPARREIETLGTVLAAGAAIIAALYAASTWQEVLGWRQGESFGVSDPILGYDVGFYVFTLPVIEQARSLAMALVALALAGAGALYLLGGQVAITPFGVRLGDRARRHLGLLVAVFFVLLAVGAWLDRPRTLLHAHRHHSWRRLHRRSRPAAVRARRDGGRADRRRPGRRLRAHRAARRRRSPPSRSTPSCVLGGQLYAGALQRFVVSPNEQVREAPYIQYNIEATRRAFALDRIVQRPLTGDAELTRADIDRNRATLDNVRLWDHQPLLETFGQIQEIRTYYDFTAVDNDRYEIDGQLRQVMLSARELNPGGAAQPHLGQRAAHLHARPRPDARPGQPGDRRRPAGALHPRPAAGVDRRTCRSPSRASTSASCRTSTRSSDQAPASSTTPRATTTSSPPTTAPAASCSTRCGRSWPSRCASATTSCCSPTTSRPRAGCSSIGRSPGGRRRSPRSSPSTTTPTWSSTTGACSGCSTPTR